MRPALASCSSPTSTRTSRKDGRGRGSGSRENQGAWSPGRAEASPHPRRVPLPWGTLQALPWELRPLGGERDGARGGLFFSPSPRRLCLFHLTFRQVGPELCGLTCCPNHLWSGGGWGWVSPLHPASLHPPCSSAFLPHSFRSSRLFSSSPPRLKGTPLISFFSSLAVLFDRKP